MKTFTFYYKGRYYTITARDVAQARGVARERFSAQFDREGFLAKVEE